MSTSNPDVSQIGGVGVPKVVSDTFYENIVLVIFGFYLIIIMVANSMFGKPGFVVGILASIGLWKGVGEPYAGRVMKELRKQNSIAPQPV
jgi:hypothetical protein